MASIVYRVFIKNLFSICEISQNCNKFLYKSDMINDVQNKCLSKSGRRYD